VTDGVVSFPRQPSEDSSYNGGPSGGFERTPPQDLQAEQSVLGGMLLSKDAIADVVEVVRSNDFYRPAHQTVYDVIVDLYGRGEPADPVTVSAELTKAGEIGRVGGAPYLHTLMSSVPTAANAGYYARIVAEQAILRRLVEAGTRIVQLGYGGGEVDETVDRAQQAIYDVTERRTSEDYTVLAELMQGTMDELEAIGSRGGSMTGVPTGFADLDSLTNGLHPGQLIVIAGRPGLGKALALDTPLPTPTGWTTMGEVAVGDQLLGADGRPTRVVAATEVMLGRPCYEVAFSDGTTIVADAEHQWVTSDNQVRTTHELASSTVPLAVRHALPLDLPDASLPASAYSLGAWAAGTQLDDETALLAGPRVEGVEGVLRGSVAQRRDALAGLLDAVATIDDDGTVRIAVRADLAAELLTGLGLAPVVVDGDVCVRTDEELFRTPTKQLRHKQLSTAGIEVRDVVAVRAIPSVPVRCVEVDNAEHLYLASRAMIPTHNSTLGLDIARSCSVKHGMSSVIFSLEMSKTEITMRLLSAEARVALHHMRSGTMTDDDWTRLARKMGDVAEAPLYIDDSPNLTMMEIRAKARRLKQRKDLKLVVIDYLQLMSGNKKAESRQQEVSELSRSLKLLAKELEVPVIAMSQLNRGAEQRTDKKPQLSDLRESGCLPASTRVMRADTGAEVTMGELFASGARDVPVWSLDSSLRYVRRHLTHVFSTGTREVFQMTLASGKRVTATANHPFLTYDGWQPLGTLSAGSRLAVPRHVPAPELEVRWPADQLLRAARSAAVGVLLPLDVFSLAKSQLRLLLRELLGAGRVDGATFLVRSLPVADQAARLLLRFGISCRIEESDRAWSLHLDDPSDRARYAGQIASGLDGEAAAEATRALLRTGHDVAPELTDDLSQVVQQRGGVLAGMTAVLDRQDLELMATNDVLWDEVVSVASLGEEEVYDATVVGTHNFIADGIAVHNSIEQDADAVILLHREDAYEKESPRAGEADFIVAKHRNGPTATVTVAFQGHYSRFVDMTPA
jgi:replicative DNA helicase